MLRRSKPSIAGQMNRKKTVRAAKREKKKKKGGKTKKRGTDPKERPRRGEPNRSVSLLGKKSLRKGRTWEVL